MIFCFSLSLSLSLSLALLCPQSRNTILDLLRSKKSRLFCAFGFSLAVPRFRFPVNRSVKQKPLSIYRCIKPSEKERARDEITRKKEERDNDGDEQQQRRRRRRPSSTFFFTSTSCPSSPAPPRAPPPRALSIQSHVASGRVGNRAALFPLALHRLDCDAINTVSFSNHTGYPRVSGSRLSAEGLEELLAGLDANGFLGSSRGRRGYDYVLTGYVGRAETLSAIKRAIERMVKSDDGNGNEKSRRPLVVVDPVMAPLSFFFFYLFFVSLCCLQRGEKELKLSFGEKNEKKKLITRKTFF